MIMKMKKQLYEASLAIMYKAHRGQYRKDGKTPYTEHPLQLATMFDCPLDKCIAVLHDAIEDGQCNGVDYQYIHAELSKVKCASRHLRYIMAGLSTLTHRRGDSYDDYIRIRVAPTVYRKFKIGDITVNLADSPSDYQKEKYKKAMKILLTHVK